MVFHKDWRWIWACSNPGVIYRPLILMPWWGRWAMMLAV